MDESYLEALKRVQDRLNAVCDDGSETLALREIDEALIELAKWAELGRPVSTQIEEIVGGWLDARSGQVDDEAIIDALGVVIERIDDQIANYRDWDSEEEYHIGHLARRRAVTRGGLFESKLLTMVGMLTELPDRGVVNKAILMKKMAAKRGKQAK